MQTASLPPPWEEFLAAAVVDEADVEAFRRWVGGLLSGVRRKDFLCLVGPMGSGKSLVAKAIMSMLPEGDTLSAGKPAKVRDAIASFANEHGKAPRLAVVDDMPHANEIVAVRLATMLNDGGLVVRDREAGSQGLLTFEAPSFVLMYQADLGYVVPGTIARRATVVRLGRIDLGRNKAGWRGCFARLEQAADEAREAFRAWAVAGYEASYAVTI
jgi:energy-coupling factor transporter ATP-binding protein EcfA2